MAIKKITLALKNCFACPHDYFTRTTNVGKRYLPDNYYHERRIERVMHLCKMGITSFVSSASSRSFMPDLLPGKLWCTQIEFRDEDIDKKSIGDIFSSFDGFVESRTI